MPKIFPSFTGLFACRLCQTLNLHIYECSFKTEFIVAFKIGKLCLRYMLPNLQRTRKKTLNQKTENSYLSNESNRQTKNKISYFDRKKYFPFKCFLKVLLKFNIMNVWQFFFLWFSIVHVLGVRFKKLLNQFYEIPHKKQTEMSTSCNKASSGNFSAF